MTNFRLIFWWFCQGVSPPVKTKNRTALRLPDFVFFMGGAQLPFSVTTLPCENGIAERPQTLRYPENKTFFSADYAQSSAERIQNQPRYIRIRCAARAMEASSRFRAGVYFFLYIPLRLCYS